MRFDPNFWKKLKSVAIVSCGGFGCYSALSIYKENEKFYDYCLMPLIHKLDPETSHKFALTISKFKLVPKTLFKDPETLKIQVWGLNFSNPIGIAAGYDKQGEAVESLHEIGFGFIEIGSVTPLPQPGNEKPRVFRLNNENAIINRYGFNSDGHDAVYKRLKTIRESSGFKGIIGVNLGKNKNSTNPIDDYVKGIKKFSDVADYFVINVSSPNTPGLRQWQKKQQLEELLSALIEAKNNLNVDKKPPLLLKLAPDLTNVERKEIADVILTEKYKVDGLVISNTTIERPGITSPIGDEKGGLSGQPLHDLSTKLISDMHHYTSGKIPIIGVGGVFTGQDAYEKIQAGASLIQLYTAFAFHGPPRIVKIKKELDELLKKDGYEYLSEAVGKSKSESKENPL
ncbi:Dihydroorotate dehydrogenase, putative [Pediculus humanus corporis]|uniref:Dihydroorotate dehydrogenase (quinone), mitochondrial n=1 Tax=Pediculus humanus subsp. corporis TaxID=121224 RepID=E0VQ82_PEDHC|nr:Dihydroorotate dehydrogenase, putative [Pediculus humanus corporis]EEB15538.1 Dihydroorotate dehydrogenase, putative [Pediculus humanus corporis]